MANKLTAEDKKWRAEEDARTLARALEIKNDKARMALAVKEADRRSKELQKESNNLKIIGKTKKQTKK